jgi:exopolysaccharide production protein ExoQ
MPLPAASAHPEADSDVSAANGLLALALLAAALLLGGGGSPAPLPETVLEGLAICTCAAWLLLPGSRDAWKRVPRSAWLVCLLALIVPLVQLIPLPPALWQALPGREPEVEALALIGRESSWRPWTMTPERTLAALLSLLPPLVLLVMATTLSLRQQLRLIVVVVAAGIATLALGALQLTAPAESPVQLYGVTTTNLRGFQANHNATADVLLAALIANYALIRIGALRGLVPNRPGPVLGLAALASGLFGFGVIFTASRMGIMLLPLALLAGLWLLRGWLPKLNRKAVIGGLVLIALLGATGAALVRSSPSLAAIAGRFQFDQDLRLELWRDGLYVARKHYPAGVGMGGFVPALVVEERLEVVRPAMPNRAHNEYIELGVEAGLFGLLAWGAIIVIVARGAAAARHVQSRSQRAAALFAAAVLILLMLHSMVDYPFRSMSLAALGALCAALLLGHRDPVAGGSFEKDQM